MKETRSGARGALIVLLTVLALLPLGFAGCEDSGDDGGSPTGPVTVYQPGMDIAGAKVTVEARHADFLLPGDDFKLLAYFYDAKGRPVQGIPLFAHAESGAGFDSTSIWFTFATNPTLTQADGSASILVHVGTSTPPESYTLVVRTFPGDPVNAAEAKGQVQIKVHAPAGP